MFNTESKDEKVELKECGDVKSRRSINVADVICTRPDPHMSKKGDYGNCIE